MSSNRCTFAIISHPDAGKTTLTEKFLLFAGAIQQAGTIKARKAARHATSDWMKLEQERGISVTSSVMQFPHQGKIMNLLDTPGHADFSEDTYRTLTAVDSALMVIDSAKGVEERTIKLMQVCRLRSTPIITFINKLDREGLDPINLLDDTEKTLGIQCVPITWPIGMGRAFRGVYHLQEQKIECFQKDGNHTVSAFLPGNEASLRELVGDAASAALLEELELVREAYPRLDREAYLRGEQTPVLFGSAINNFGVRATLDHFAELAPGPLPRKAEQRTVAVEENKVSGFVFKIQANMDPAHRDRIAFFRVCSGHYHKGDKLFHVRSGKTLNIANVLTFMAGSRNHVDEAEAGDIIGLYNHGNIQVGDTLTQGEKLTFTGIPHFAPELFRRIQLRDPLKMKTLAKGVQQLCEEGATQLFRPHNSNDYLLGAVGVLQFDVVAHRLKAEYNVDAYFDTIALATARWVMCDDPLMLQRFKDKNIDHLADDGSGYLVYLAPTQVNLRLTQERWPEVRFLSTREA